MSAALDIASPPTAVAEIRAPARQSLVVMRCGWGSGCPRPATQVWLRGKRFANALCQEHADSLRRVLPQAHFMRWPEKRAAASNGR